jgi:hypothetical protein
MELHPMSIRGYNNHDLRKEANMDVRKSRAILLLLLLSALTACASAPSALPPSTAPQIAASSAKGADVAALPSDARPGPPGFKRTVRNGEEYFCQSRKLTGSRARTTEVCFTRDDLLRMEQINEEYRKNAMTNGSQSTIQMDSPTGAGPP